MSEQFPGRPLSPSIKEDASAGQMFRSGECNPSSGAEVARRSLTVVHGEAKAVV